LLPPFGNQQKPIAVRLLSWSFGVAAGGVLSFSPLSFVATVDGNTTALLQATDQVQFFPAACLLVQNITPTATRHTAFTMDLRTDRGGLGTGASPTATPSESFQFDVSKAAMDSDVPNAIVDGRNPQPPGTFFEVFNHVGDSAPAFSMPVSFGGIGLSNPSQPGPNGRPSTFAPLTLLARTDSNTSKLLTALINGKTYAQLAVIVRQAGSTGVVASNVTIGERSVPVQALQFSGGDAPTPPKVSIAFSPNTFSLSTTFPPG
jgi:hypothetical protein